MQQSLQKSENVTDDVSLFSIEWCVNNSTQNASEQTGSFNQNILK